ncbi:MAG TPA: hypothetical protein VHK69_12710, partial [Chitinophagaceae bacterium]|nr:hypothetical protein [Chitinophagaceae bacterium]
MEHTTLRHRQYYRLFLSCLLASGLAFSCSKPKGGPAPTEPVTVPVVKDTTAVISVNRSLKQQIIDGFGFFGAQDVWWAGGNLFSEAWAVQAIDDLGMTIWRNEYYPDDAGQDADWAKQKPVVEGLAKAARERNVPLKFIFTVWSPPARFKCALDNDNNPVSGTPHPGGAKKGGTLDPAKYTEFGNWLADGIQLYKNSGVDVYAISPQNEPLFKQDFNSCYYKPQKWYGEMLKQALPVVRQRFPAIKFFGSENMLG